MKITIDEKVMEILDDCSEVFYTWGSHTNEYKQAYNKAQSKLVSMIAEKDKRIEELEKDYIKLTKEKISHNKSAREEIAKLKEIIEFIKERVVKVEFAFRDRHYIDAIDVINKKLKEYKT